MSPRNGWGLWLSIPSGGREGHSCQWRDRDRATLGGQGHCTTSTHRKTQSGHSSKPNPAQSSGIRVALSAKPFPEARSPLRREPRFCSIPVKGREHPWEHPSSIPAPPQHPKPAPGNPSDGRRASPVPHHPGSPTLGNGTAVPALEQRWSKSDEPG